MVKRETMAALGPCPIPFYPVDAWTESPLGTQKQLYDLWRLVGPTVAKHQERMPLWQVFIVVYVEGLLHGMQGLEKIQEQEREETWTDYQI